MKIKIIKIFLHIILLVFLSCSSLAFAQINAYPSIVNLSVNSLREDVLVSNHGKETAYVRVTPRLLENPGTPKQKEVTIRNPRELGLLVSPQKLAIPPGQFRLVRIVSIKPSIKIDRIYIVSIEPILGQLKFLQDSDNQARMAIKVVVGYGILVMNRPKLLEPRITMTRRGRTVTVKNIGNTTIFLQYGQQCVRANQCTPLPTPVKRMFPGNTWTFTAPKSMPVFFHGLFAGDSKMYRSN